MPTDGNNPVDSPLWHRCDATILPLWWERLRAGSSYESALLYAAGLFTEDRRRPIAQWWNEALDAALLVAPETGPEWPIQRFGIFYAPPGAGFHRVHSQQHQWNPRSPLAHPTEAEAFSAAIVAAEGFLAVEMDYV
ncbi:MAG: hypothetical protein HIU81_07650 [Acidobacteria bacterium]|nr:hypothetical protein [Acidobacteriota bacterium]